MERSSKKAAMTAILLLFATAITSCGYHLSGKGGIVPEGVRTIAVPVFLNSTNEPFVDVEVTRAVVEEFLTDGRLDVTGPEEADLALRGSIVKYQVGALSYTGQSHVRQYQIRLVIDASLEDLRSRKIVWQEKGVESSFISQYTITYSTEDTEAVDIRTTRIAKDAALKKAAQDIAATLRSRVLEGF